jgi:hypothetical protein
MVSDLYWLVAASQKHKGKEIPWTLLSQEIFEYPLLDMASRKSVSIAITDKYILKEYSKHPKCILLCLHHKQQECSYVV